MWRNDGGNEESFFPPRIPSFIDERPFILFKMLRACKFIKNVVKPKIPRRYFSNEEVC